MPATVFLFIVFGLIFGSFGNVLIVRLRSHKSLGGRSHCETCKRPLGIIDLVPVLSYVLLGGRCRRCSSLISLRYPIIELLSGFVFALAAALHPNDLLPAVLTAAILYILLLSSAFDVLYESLPDVFTVAIAVLGLLLTLLSGDIFSSLLGVAVAVAMFGVQWIISRGKAVGSGDVFLAAALAVWLGFRGTISMILLSYAIGTVIVLLLLGFGVITMKQKRIAFGPFLALGAVLSLLGASWM